MPDDINDAAETASARAKARSRTRRESATRAGNSGDPKPGGIPKADTRDRTKEPKSVLNPDGKRTPKWAKMETQLTELYSALALPFVMMGDNQCANLLATNAPILASSWVDLAQENPGVERVISNLLTGTAWGGVIVAHAMVAVPIAAHHNLIPGEIGQRVGLAFAMAGAAQQSNGHAPTPTA